MSDLQVLDRIRGISCCPAVQYRIKTLLKEEIGTELFDAFYRSKWVELLKANQLDDGGFGRFHSRDSKIKQKFPTTEMAVDSMRLLGITRGNPLADRLCDYMEKLLKREIEWPDGFEKNKWYRPAQPLFVASKLSVFGSDCGAYRDIFGLWHVILKEAFIDDEYNAERTDRIAKELLGCDIDGRYIGLNSVYPIELFANMQDQISEALKRSYLKWLHHNGKPIQYTGVVLNKGLDNSFSALYRVYSLLSGFSCFKTEFKEELDQLMNKRNPDGFWNFGGDFNCQRLSDDWKTRINMDIDHTILILLLFGT